MITRVESFVLRGIGAVPCEIEVDVCGASLPSTTMVGLPDRVVRESMDRVRTVLANGGFGYPRGRVTISLAPADLRKEGPIYDLPLAVALLEAGRTIAPSAGSGWGSPADDRAAGDRAAGVAPSPRDFLMAGELALDGRVRRIRGAISLALLAQSLGRRGVILPLENAAEAAMVDGIRVLGVSSIDEVVECLNGHRTIEPFVAAVRPGAGGEDGAGGETVDLVDIRGQESAKRALTVAAAGAHNLLMLGPAGTGKTMLAKALAGILPPLTRAEALEVTCIYSCAGKLPPGGALVSRRPVRAPHHTASAAAVVGGGSIPRPGDVSLAHRGVLFLDEMPEFSRAVLETLRQPLEDGAVTIARAQGSTRFPARFMLVGALNPTARGHLAPDEASHRAMERYLQRLSGPLIDRIDMHVEVPAVSFRQLTDERRGPDSATVRERVIAARVVQRTRQGPKTNAELSGRELDARARLDGPACTLLGQAMTELGLSARAYDRIRRVARTIADVERAPDVAVHHIAEAVQYRLLDRLGRVG